MMRRRVVAALICAVVASCSEARRAKEADCAALLDRLIELEAQEHGFQDQALVDRWRSAARTRYASELAACRGRRVPSSAHACAARVTTSEELARCLR
jgi:hypothetical protein